MQSVQRRFGRLTTKSTADDSQVAVLMKDFDYADVLLGRIIDHTAAWKDAWISVVTFQSRMADEFDGMYAPIVGSVEMPTQHVPVDTDRRLLARTNRLRRDYDELREDLIQELSDVDRRMTQPAASARDLIIPVKKTIKKRNDKKADFERDQARVDGLLHKQRRTDSENIKLAKAQIDLANSKEIYAAADEDLRQRLPTLVKLLFSLSPIIQRAQIEIQNRMLGSYYTVLHSYCQDERFPSPPQTMSQVIQDFERAQRPVRAEFESFGILTHGKAIRESLVQEAQNQNQAKRPSLSTRFSSSNLSINKKNAAPPPPLLSKPSFTHSVRSLSPSSCLTNPTPRGSVSVSVASSASTFSLPSGNGSWTPDAPISRAPSPRPKPAGLSFSPAGPTSDLFQRGRQAGVADSVANIAAKKRPPPPPPRPVTNFVTALYDFGGEGSGDLSFREGDRIKIVSKTNSTDDWWEGEINGVQGSFPANYVK